MRLRTAAIQMLSSWKVAHLPEVVSQRAVALQSRGEMVLAALMRGVNPVQEAGPVRPKLV